MKKQKQLYEVHFWNTRDDVRKLKGETYKGARRFAKKLLDYDWCNIKIIYYRNKRVN